MHIRSVVLPGVVVLFSGLLGACAMTEETRAAAEPCPQHASPKPVYSTIKYCSPNDRSRQVRDLGALMEEVAALTHEGEHALRKALESAADEPLRQALVLLALDDPANDQQALGLLETHLNGANSTEGERLLAGLLRDQIQARQALRSSLSGARSERDALQRQLDELKAIEEQIRDRSRNPEAELRNQP
jgi:hypothetical protein